MSRRDILAAGLFALLAAAPAHGEETQDDGTPPVPDFAFSLISENEILTRFNRRTAETEFTAQYNAFAHGPVVTGFAVVTGRELTLDADGNPRPDSNDYGGLAVRVSRKEIVFSAEARYASDFTISPAGSAQETGGRSGPDHRLRLNRWRKTTIALARLPDWSFLNESWIDAEWLPFRDNNGIFNASDVLGLRTQISPAVAADLYLEPFILLDANRTYDNNRLEMRGSTRLNLSTGNITLQATAACVHNYDLDRGDFPENENRKSEWSRRFALVLLANL